MTAWTAVGVTAVAAIAIAVLFALNSHGAKKDLTAEKPPSQSPDVERVDPEEPNPKAVAQTPKIDVAESGSKERQPETAHVSPQAVSSKAGGSSTVAAPKPPRAATEAREPPASARRFPRGRFIRIELPRTGTLTLAEVEVYSGGTISFFDPASGQPVHKEIHVSDADVGWLAFHPQRPWIVAAHAQDQLARIWDYQTSELLCELKGHDGDVNCAEFSRDGRQVATASADMSIRIWDLAGPDLPAAPKKGKKSKPAPAIVGD